MNNLFFTKKTIAPPPGIKWSATNEIKTAQNIPQFKYLLKCHLMSQV